MFPPIRPPPFPFPFRLPLLRQPHPTTSTRTLHTSSPSLKRFKPQPLFLLPGQTEDSARQERKAREASELRAKRDRTLKRIDLYKDAGFDTTDWGRNRVRKNKGMENWLALRKMRLIAEGKLDPIEEERRERARVMGKSVRDRDGQGRVAEEDGPYGLKSGSVSAAASWEKELEESSWREDESAPEPAPSLDEHGNPLPFGLRYRPTHQPIPSSSLPKDTWSNSGLSVKTSGPDDLPSSWSATKPDGTLRDWQAFAQAEKAVEEEKQLPTDNPKLVSEVQRLLSLAARTDINEPSNVAKARSTTFEDSVTAASSPSSPRHQRTADRISSFPNSNPHRPPQPSSPTRRSSPDLPSSKAWSRNDWERMTPAESTARTVPRSTRPSSVGRPSGGGTPAWYQGAGKGAKTDRSTGAGAAAAGPKRYGLRSYSTDSRGGRQAERMAGFGRPASHGMRAASPRFPMRPPVVQRPKLSPAVESADVDSDDPVYRTGRPPRGSAGWAPTKRLSRPAMAGLKQLYQQDPQKHDRFFLSKEFGISVEAVNRILRSDGRWQKKRGKGSSSEEPEE